MKVSFIFILLRLLFPVPIKSQSAPIVTTISTCEFANGMRINPCKIAYRTYGRLNAARDNVVLIPTWLLGRSEDWISYGLLGPKALVDTSVFYTIIVDALGNGRSQSPSNTDEPLRRAFDDLTIADMVRSQHRLLTENLGINHIHAVVGASMGGMQAFEWAVRFPGFADRIVPIIGSPRIGSFDYLLWSTLRGIIDDGIQGNIPHQEVWLQLSRMETLFSRTPRAVNLVKPDSIAREVTDFAKTLGNSWKLEDYRAQLGAMIRHDVAADLGGDLNAAAGKVRSRIMMVYSWDDHMVTAEAGAEFGKLISADSTVVASPNGHMMFIYDADKVFPAVRAFLEGVASHQGH